MKLIQNKVYLTMEECVGSGMDERYLRKAKSVGAKCWDFMDDPEDRRRVLVGYDALKPAYKRMVQKTFGNPYEHVALLPILNLVNTVVNFEAEDYFKKFSYKLVNGKEVILEESTLDKYIRADKWLRVLSEIKKPFIKKELKISVVDFYINVSKLIALEQEHGKNENYIGHDVLPGNFPASYRKLMPRVALYREEGYSGIIDKRFGNASGAKLGVVNSAIRQFDNSTMPGERMIEGVELTENCAENEVIESKTAINVPKSANKGGAFDPELYERQMAVIRAVSAKAQNMDAGQVCDLVNIVFGANGWKTLSRERFGQIMRENMNVLTPGRRGKRAYMNEVAMQVKRVAPDRPLKYWTLDGWTVELLYQERGAKGIEYKRLVAVIVLDPYNKYPIGYAIGDRETPELIREANRNAMLHVHELFGALYAPWQLQSDNYAVKTLTPFYSAVSRLYIPAAVGNAKAKVIEPYFRYLNKQYCQLQDNWFGHNINANKKNQVNTEYLNKVKKNFPDRAGAEAQIHLMMQQERSKKQAQYVGCAMQGTITFALDNQVMSDMDWLMVFGNVVGDRTNRITGGCIEKVINGCKYWYDSFDPAFHALMDRDWTIYADLQDLSRVLATADNGKLKFVLQHKRMIPMDVRSASDEDHAYRADVTRFNKDRMTEVMERNAQDYFIAGQVIGSMEPRELTTAEDIALKGMFVHNGQQKDGLQDAKRLHAAAPVPVDLSMQVMEERRMDRMRGIVDIGSFLNGE